MRSDNQGGKGHEPHAKKTNSATKRGEKRGPAVSGELASGDHMPFKKKVSGVHGEKEKRKGGKGALQTAGVGRREVPEIILHAPKGLKGVISSKEMRLPGGTG